MTYDFKVRLPIEPLIEVITAGWAGGNDSGHQNQHTGVVTEAASQLGVPRRSVWRWKADGGTPIDTLDRLCIRVGLHPVEVYGWGVWNEAWDLHDARREQARRISKERRRTNRRRPKEMAAA